MPRTADRACIRDLSMHLVLAGYRSGGNHSLTFIDDDRGEVAW